MKAQRKKQVYLRILIKILLPILCFNISQATENSWEIYNAGLTGGNIQAIAIDPDDSNIVYIGTFGGGFYWSENCRSNYPTWYQENTNLKCWNILSLMVKDRAIYAGTTQGIFSLELNNLGNGTAEWTEYLDPEGKLSNYMILRLRNCSDRKDSTAFYAIGCNVVANDFQRKLIIVEKDQALRFANFDPYTINVYDVAPYRDTDQTDQDELGKMYVGTDSGVFQFRDYLNASWDSTQVLIDKEIFCLSERLFNDTTFTVYAGTQNGGRLSYVSGWWRPFSNLEDSCIVHLEPWFSNNVNFQKIYAITQNSSIYYNDDIFKKWLPDPKNNSFPQASINAFAAHEKMFDSPFIGTNDGIYNKIDNTNWNCINADSFFANSIHTIIHETSNDYDQLWAGSDGMLFHRELDSESAWQKDYVYKHITTIAYHPEKDELYLGTKNQGIFVKENGGQYNSLIQGGLTDSSKITIIVFENNKNPNMYIGTADGIIFIRNESKEWKKIENLIQDRITSIALDSTQSSTFIYVSTTEKIYRINTSHPNLSSSWNARTYVNSLVFNNPDSVVFAGTAKGIKYHPIDSAIEDDWDIYEHLSLTNNNVRQLHIIPTDPSFKGVLYAMTSDSVRRVSQIWRNVIGENITESTIDDTPDFERQCGESFCVNLNDPNKVYMGTGGSGVYQYLFDQGETPDITPDSIDFGDIPQNAEMTKTITIQNKNFFSPLIVFLELGDTANFRLETPDSIVVFPGITQICSVTFKPQLHDEIKSNLNIEWRDIFLNPVMQGSQTIELLGTGKGGDFTLNGKADDIFNFTLKIHVGDTLTKILKWKKEGNVTLTEFDVNGPIDLHYSKIPPNWKNEFDNNDSGEVSIKFSSAERDTILDSISIKYDYVRSDSTFPRNKTINLRGIGLDAILVVEKDTIDFNYIPIGDRSYNEYVHLKNEGNIPLIIHKDQISCNSPFIYSIIQDEPDTIKAGDERDYFEICFKPNLIKRFVDTLVISYHDSASSIVETTQVILIGNGDKDKVKIFPPEALNFDTVHVIKLPVKKTLEIINIASRFTVWIDSIKLFEKIAFRIKTQLDSVIQLEPFDSTSNQTNNRIDICFEFFADSTKDTREILGDYIDSTYVYYRYGNPHPDSMKFSAIRLDTLFGRIISSIREGDPSDWEPITPINTCDSTSFIYKNDGNIPFYRKIIRLPQDTVFSHNLSYGKIDSIFDDNELNDSLKFCPLDKATHRDSIVILFWDVDIHGDTCINDFVKIYLSGKGIDNIRPIIESVEYSDPTWKQPVTVTARVYDEHSGLRENSPLLFIRKGGDFNFTPLKMVDTGNSNSIYCAIIPGEDITSKGIEFFIAAIDCSATEAYYPPIESEFRYLSPPVTITAPGITKTKDYLDDGKIEFLHGGNAQQDYRFISIPLDSLSCSTKDILRQSFGLEDYHEHRWRCIDYQYNSEDDSIKILEIDTYDMEKPFSEFIPGKSFLLLINYRYPLRSIQKQTGKTITTGQVFRYQLHKGWNFIANPFNFPIPIDNVSLADKLYSYEGKRIKVKDQQQEKQYLFPWEGNAVYVDSAYTLLICPNLNPEYGLTNLFKSSEKPGYEWFISINASCQQAQDTNNFAAILKNSKFEFDYYDSPEPPPIGEYVMISFPHPEWEKACDDFAVDVQPPNNEGNFWDFAVGTNIKNSEVKLNFNNLNSVPDEFNIFLICENLNVIQNLREKKEIVFKSATNFSEHTFRLLVGKEDFIDNNDLDIDRLPKDYKLFASYPNPFRINTEIKYELPKQEQVTIVIYNLLGELVKKIEQKTKSPGKYFVTWDGTDEKNLPVRNGVYFCKFLTPNFSKTIKMTLIK